MNVNVEIIGRRQISVAMKQIDTLQHLKYLQRSQHSEHLQHLQHSKHSQHETHSHEQVRSWLHIKGIIGIRQQTRLMKKHTRFFNPEQRM